MSFANIFFLTGERRAKDILAARANVKHGDITLYKTVDSNRGTFVTSIKDNLANVDKIADQLYLFCPHIQYVYHHTKPLLFSK